MFYGDFKNVIICVNNYYEREEKINNCSESVIVRIRFVVFVINFNKFFSWKGLIG